MTVVAAPKRLPRHIGFIPDGNRRWAVTQQHPKEAGYANGIEPGLRLFQICSDLKIPEISIYGFTQDNTRRPSVQTRAFRNACVSFGLEVAARGAALLTIGDETSAQFPPELLPYRKRQGDGMKVNLLVNYGWEWDLAAMKTGPAQSAEISRMDLIVRWGGARRLSGFLPVQSVYADMFVVDELWPDFEPGQFQRSLDWFNVQDRTLGG